jgi:DEAD/DEAH box helicase domain-containing protein
MNYVVFDIETRNIFDDVGSTNPRDLDISVVGAYSSVHNKYGAFFQEELPELWKWIEESDMLVGYNSDHFDIPLLAKYYHGDLSKIKSLDILKEIKDSFGRRMRLDQVAEGTLGVNKSGHGLQAITWWKTGQFEQLKKYCLDDVKITKKLFDYALKNNKLKFKEGGKVITIPLNTEKWMPTEKSGVTFSLPF